MKYLHLQIACEGGVIWIQFDTKIRILFDENIWKLCCWQLASCVAWSVMTRRTGQLFILSINWIFAGKLGQRKRTAWKYWMLPPIVKPYCYRLERQLSPRRRVPPRARNLPISTTRHVAGSTSSDCQVINIFGKYFCSPLSKKYFVRLYCWLLGGWDCC